MNCKGCQATVDPSALICEYCGVMTGNISTDAEEMLAVNELLKALQRAGSITMPAVDIVGIDPNIAWRKIHSDSQAFFAGGGPAGRFLSAMWTPTSAEAIVRLCLPLMSMGKVGKKSGYINADSADIELRTIARRRVMGMLDAADLTNPGDHRVLAMREKISEEMQAAEADAAKNSRFRKKIWGGIALAVPVIILVTLIYELKVKQDNRDRLRELHAQYDIQNAAMMEERRRGEVESLHAITVQECRGTGVECYQRCQELACRQLCEAGEHWACTAAAPAPPPPPRSRSHGR